MTILNKRKIKNLTVSYDEKIITVKRSYKLDSYEEILEFCEEMRTELPFKYSRTAVSWAKEIDAHNFLYRLNLFKMQTADTDIEESEKWYRLIGYEVLHFFQSIFYMWEWLEGKD